MANDTRFWYMTYNPDQQSIVIMIRPDIWAKIAVARNWFELEGRFYTQNGVLTPPTRTRRFGVRRALIFNRAGKVHPWPSVECPLLAGGMDGRSYQRRIIRDQLITLNLLFSFLHMFHDNSLTADQPFDLTWIGPVGGAEFCLTGNLSSPVAKQMYTSPDLWPPVTHNMLRAFHYLGGSQELLEKVGADWYDGGPRLACDRTMLRLPYEPTRYPKADPPPDWPVMSTSTRTSAELLVLLVGLASVDNLLRRRGERRAA